MVAKSKGWGKGYDNASAIPGAGVVENGQVVSCCGDEGVGL